MHHFYYLPGACAFAVHVVLEETGVPYTAQRRALHDTAHADYLALNPKGRVPALSGVPGNAGGAPDLLTEVSAILVYLARSHPAAGLLPADPGAEARCLEWLSWLSIDVHGIGFGQLWRPGRFVRDEALHGAVIEQGRHNIHAAFDHIEHILADGRAWAIPEGYSVVDPYLSVFWLWGKRIGLDMDTHWPRFTRLVATVLDRPAARRALAQEGMAGFLQLWQPEAS